MCACLCFLTCGTFYFGFDSTRICDECGAQLCCTCMLRTIGLGVQHGVHFRLLPDIFSLQDEVKYCEASRYAVNCWNIYIYLFFLFVDGFYLFIHMGIAMTLSNALCWWTCACFRMELWWYSWCSGWLLSSEAWLQSAPFSCHNEIEYLHRGFEQCCRVEAHGLAHKWPARIAQTRWPIFNSHSQP